MLTPDERAYYETPWAYSYTDSGGEEHVKKFFAVTYATAVLSLHGSEREAWDEHDARVLAGLNPDKLAIVEKT